jgi:hypothetical protein
MHVCVSQGQRPQATLEFDLICIPVSKVEQCNLARVRVNLEVNPADQNSNWGGLSATESDVIAY